MKGNVTVIPPKRIIGNNVRKEEKKKIRVAAYCRVSTDSDEQEESYKAQVDHYTRYINNRDDWTFAGVFSDEGITGTNTKKREGFNSMIDACDKGEIDLIITKSISRFSRNTLDCLKYVRHLRDKNIPIIFEKENINTMEASGELLLTIMASLAQQESQSLSQNVKLGFQYRFQNGQVQVNHNRFLGYTKNSEGKLVIDEEQAKIVRRIYKEYLDGASFNTIGKGLERDGIKTSTGNSGWHGTSVKGILTNEKYIGDALLQKTITTSFIDKKRIKNDGSSPQYYVTDDHEPIIPRDLFIQVQEEIERRANMTSGKSDRKVCFSSKYALTNVCLCGKCGDKYRRLQLHKNGVEKVVWRCCERLSSGNRCCDGPTIEEKEIHQSVVKAINQLMEDTSQTKKIFKNNLEKAITNDNSKELNEIEESLNVKQKQLLSLMHGNKDYDSIADEVNNLRNQKEKIVFENSKKEAYKNRIKELEEFIDSRDFEVTEYDDKFVRKYIKEIYIYKDRLEVTFKADITIVIPR